MFQTLKLYNFIVRRQNSLGVDHVFIADKDDNMVYGGFVGWIHSEGLNQAINRIRRDYR